MNIWGLPRLVHRATHIPIPGTSAINGSLLSGKSSPKTRCVFPCLSYMNSAGFWCSLSWKNTSIVCWQQLHSPIKNGKKTQNRSSEATSFHSKISIFRVKLWKMWRPAKYWFQTIGISPNRLWFYPLYIYIIIYTLYNYSPLMFSFSIRQFIWKTKMVWKKIQHQPIGLEFSSGTTRQ